MVTGSKSFQGGILRSAGLITLILTLLVSCSSGDDASPADDDVANLLPGEVPVIETAVVDVDVDAYEPPGEINEDMYTILSSAGEFTRLIELVDRAGLGNTLAGDTPITLFAPTDEAFYLLDQYIGEGVVDTFTVTELQDRLTYHIIDSDAMKFDTLFEVTGQALLMSNGLAAEFSMSPAGQLMINNATVTSPDLMASNGIIHIIDTVLTPPERIADPNDSIPLPSSQTMADYMLEQPDYSVLLYLIGEAGMTEALQGDNEGMGWTLFAPSDDAFYKNGYDGFGLDPEQAVAFVRLHLYPGTLYSTDMSAGPLLMLDGSVQVDRLETGIQAGGASIVGRDRGVANGVIHFISAPMVAQ